MGMKDRLQEPNSNSYGLSNDFNNMYSPQAPAGSHSLIKTLLPSSLHAKITDLTPNIVAVYNLQTGEYIFINGSLKPLLGYEPSDWINKGLKHIITKVHPEDLPRILRENKEAVKSSNTLSDNRIFEFEYRIKHADGTYKWLKTYGTVFDRDESGKVRHVINISLDITAMKAAEEKLLHLTNELEKKIAERTFELNTNIKKFQVLIENSTDAIVLISKSGRIEYASPGTEKVLGFTPEEFLEIKKPGDLIHPEDRKNVSKLFNLHFRTPQDKLKTRFRAKNKSGDYHWIEIIASNLLNEKSIKAVVLNFRDITSQVLNEETHKEEIQNAALRADISEALSQRHDLEKTMELCVKAITDKLGTSLTKVWILDEKTNILKLSSFSGTKKVLKDRLIQSKWAKARDGRIAFEKEPYLTNDALHDKKVSDKVWIKKHKIKSFGGYPLILGNNLSGLLTVFSEHEIPAHTHETLSLIANSLAQGTGRLQVKEALTNSEEQYRTIFSTLTEGIVLQDAKGEILAANSSAQKIFQTNFAELKDSSIRKDRWNNYIHEDGSSFSIEDFPFTRALKTGEPQKNITIGIIKNHQTTWLLANSIPLKDTKRQTYAVASSLQDITQQKKLEKQKDEFISIASHELKTPLTTVKSFTEILKMQFQKEEKAQHYLGKMNREIDRLTGLVNDLLDVSKIQSGGLILIKGPVELNEFLTEFIEDIQSAYPNHEITAKRLIKDTLSLDKQRIYEVLTNLVSNAVKYSPKSNKIILSTEKKGDKIIFKVKDFGIGITKRDKKKIFDPFFQAQTTIRQSHSGLGLGLHIAREIIIKHGGEITVTSRKGVGSVFRFSLPLQTKQ